jgi:hypothetical protein
MLVREKHSSSLDPFVIYAKNEVLQIRTQQKTFALIYHSIGDDEVQTFHNTDTWKVFLLG